MGLAEDNKIGPVIKCPHCGAEWVPSEIFMPGDVEGKAKQVIRDALGHILYVEYEEDCEPCSEQHYVCDECGRGFVVEPVVMFKVKKESEELDFGSQETSLLD